MPIDDEKRLEVGVVPVGEGEVHLRGAGQGEIDGGPWKRREGRDSLRTVNAHHSFSRSGMSALAIGS